MNPSGAIIIGIGAGLIPYFVGLNLKALLGYDDALDTFAIRGTLGAILTGFLAHVDSNLNLTTHLKDLVARRSGWSNSKASA